MVAIISNHPLTHTFLSRINALVEIGHLKSAYLLAVESRDDDQLRKIAAQAELTNQTIIKRLCEKRLIKYTY